MKRSNYHLTNRLEGMVKKASWTGFNSEMTNMTALVVKLIN